jgi:hypothetical protein
MRCYMSDPDDRFPAEPDPFEALATPGMVAGYIWKVAGENGLRDLLSRDVEKPLDRETVLDMASELAQQGLRRAAGIAEEIAATKPSMTDMVFCPYVGPPYTDNPRGNEINIRHWLRGQQRRQSERELQRERRLKAKPAAFKK